MIDDLRTEIESIKEKLIDEIKNIQSLEKFHELRDKFLSRRRGIFSSLMTKLKELPPKEKPLFGSLINSAKKFTEEKLKEAEGNFGIKSEKRIDGSLPEYNIVLGSTHLITYIRRYIEDIFLKMGYAIAEGPEIEYEENNFTLLNFKEDHPARDEQDTFFMHGHDNLLLRTHTSPVQIRYMKNNEPPIKIISPGKVYRKDEPDATHVPVFHQVEGLLVDSDINFSHLKGTLELFLRTLFGNETLLRFRPGYFPFTEPSAEVDISCFLCGGENSKCRICKGSGWLEILGSGMVHREVLSNCGIDPDEFSGFAFGMGIERIAMLKYGVTDLRYLYENDLRFNNQFG